MKEFKVQVTKPASSVALMTLQATSPLKAKAIAEYKATEKPENFAWHPGSAIKGSRMRVDILETNDVD